MTQPGAMLLPAVRRLFLAALERGAIDKEHCLTLTANSAGNPLMGIFIGLEDGEPRTMVTVRLPTDPKLDRPLFDLAANLGGSKALRDAVMQTAADFIRSAGYDTAWAWNQTGASDAAYLRLTRLAGYNSRHRCSLIELDLGKKDPENGRRS